MYALQTHHQTLPTIPSVYNSFPAYHPNSNNQFVCNSFPHSSVSSGSYSTVNSVINAKQFQNSSERFAECNNQENKTNFLYKVDQGEIQNSHIDQYPKQQSKESKPVTFHDEKIKESKEKKKKIDDLFSKINGDS